MGQIAVSRAAERHETLSLRAPGPHAHRPPTPLSASSSEPARTHSKRKASWFGLTSHPRSTRRSANTEPLEPSRRSIRRAAVQGIGETPQIGGDIPSRSGEGVMPPPPRRLKGGSFKGSWSPAPLTHRCACAAPRDVSRQRRATFRRDADGRRRLGRRLA
jgi:hypothetical protein